MVDRELKGSDCGIAWGELLRALVKVQESGCVREWEMIPLKSGDMPMWYKRWGDLPGVTMEMRRMAAHQVRMGSGNIWKGLWGHHIDDLENLLSKQVLDWKGRDCGTGGYSRAEQNANDTTEL